MRLRLIDRAFIKVGQPLPWPIYDETGRLLLNAGLTVDSQEQLEALLDRGVYRSIEESGKAAKPVRKEPIRPRISPFGQMSEWRERLRRAHEAITAAQEDAERKVLILADELWRVCEADPDACLGLLHLHSSDPSPIEQTLYHAILCQRLAARMGFSQERGRTLLAATLTANIALLPYQDRLNQSTIPLTARLREVINKHPVQSAAQLRQAGIRDELWLKIVEQHHETVDGKGYPAGLFGSAVLSEAKMIATAEHYVAMVTVRGYRRRHNPEEALAEIMRQAGKDPDEPLYPALFKELSSYPPGTMVRLASGEVAVVVWRGSDPARPKVKAFLNPQGRAYLGPLLRDTSQKDYAIEEIFHPRILPALNTAALWDYGG